MKWIQRMVSVCLLYVTTLFYIVLRIQHSRNFSEESFPVAECVHPLSEHAEYLQKQGRVQVPDVHLYERRQFGPGN